MSAQKKLFLFLIIFTFLSISTPCKMGGVVSTVTEQLGDLVFALPEPTIKSDEIIAQSLREAEGYETRDLPRRAIYTPEGPRAESEKPHREPELEKPHREPELEKIRKLNALHQQRIEEMVGIHGTIADSCKEFARENLLSKKPPASLSLNMQYLRRLQRIVAGHLHPTRAEAHIELSVIINKFFSIIASPGDMIEKKSVLLDLFAELKNFYLAQPNATNDQKVWKIHSSCFVKDVVKYTLTRIFNQFEEEKPTKVAGIRNPDETNLDTFIQIYAGLAYQEGVVYFGDLYGRYYQEYNLKDPWETRFPLLATEPRFSIS